MSTAAETPPSSRTEAPGRKSGFARLAWLPALVAVVLALIFSSLFSWTPGLKTVSPGLSIVICTVAAAAICAALFPVKEEREAA